MNEMTIQQAGTVVAGLYKQITGQPVPAPLDLSAYISVATTAIKTGWDKVMNALSAMWGETVFAVRPYTGPLQDMTFSTTRWGAADRKVSYASRIPGINAAYDYPVTYDATETSNPTGDGLSVDMYKINKDKIVQTVFYGRSTYAYHRTRFLTQLETAFKTPEELVRYNAAAVQALANDREGWAESMRRGMLVNAIGSLAAEGQSGRVVHLLTEYNTATGQELTATTVRLPANYAPFCRWAYARMGEIADRMKNNNILYTTQLAALTTDGYYVLRHTPRDRLKIKMISRELNHIRASVLSTTYNEEYLNLDGVEGIDWWQTPATPDAISVTPTYTAADGTVATHDPVTASGIIGIMYDEDFIGCTKIRDSVYTTPFNPNGEYWNDFYKEEYKTRFDMTEKAVLLVLD